MAARLLRNVWVSRLLFLQLLWVTSSGEENVTTNLYSDVFLPCKFPFVFGPSSLDMIWEKVEEDGTKRLLHKLTNGRHDLSEQDPQYRWRTKLSEDFSRGNLGLTLSDVVFADEGTYYCRAANERHHGDRKVELSVSGLEAQDPTVTSIHKDGSRDLKCIGRGLFREPRVLWFRQDMEELSGQATLTITDLGDRMKKVESVLPDVEKNEQYICDIEEGKFHRKVRAVISDGTSTIHVDGGGGDP